MPKARFVGDPADNNSGPGVMQYLGLSFPMKEWVDVNDAQAEKLARHSHYEVKGVRAKAAAAEATASETGEATDTGGAENDQAEA